METKNKKNIEKETIEQKPKSRFTLWREKYPEGLDGIIVNMRAVLR
jgi:hypothetical protein